jgi:hypothetical protein
MNASEEFRATVFLFHHLAVELERMGGMKRAERAEIVRDMAAKAGPSDCSDLLMGVANVLEGTDPASRADTTHLAVIDGGRED